MGYRYESIVIQMMRGGCAHTGGKGVTVLDRRAAQCRSTLGVGERKAATREPTTVKMLPIEVIEAAGGGGGSGGRVQDSGEIIGSVVLAAVHRGDVRRRGGRGQSSTEDELPNNRMRIRHDNAARRGREGGKAHRPTKREERDGKGQSTC